MKDREQWNQRYASTDLVWSAQPNQLFAGEVKNLTPGTALDVACGEGRNAIHLAELGWQVTAIDFSDVAIDKGRQIAERRGLALSWQVGDVTTADFPTQAFDLVAVIFLHSPPSIRHRWLPRVIDAVRPGGTFIYLGHDPRNVTEGVGGPQDTALLPSPTQVSDCLGGFEIERARTVVRKVSADPGHGGGSEGTALDTLVVATRA